MLAEVASKIEELQSAIRIDKERFELGIDKTPKFYRELKLSCYLARIESLKKYGH